MNLELSPDLRNFGKTQPRELTLLQRCENVSQAIPVLSRQFSKKQKDFLKEIIYLVF
jgi:hypothetical protein